MSTRDGTSGRRSSRSDAAGSPACVHAVSDGLSLRRSRGSIAAGRVANGRANGRNGHVAGRLSGRCAPNAASSSRRTDRRRGRVRLGAASSGDVTVKRHDYTWSASRQSRRSSELNPCKPRGLSWERPRAPWSRVTCNDTGSRPRRDGAAGAQLRRPGQTRPADVRPSARPSRKRTGPTFAKGAGRPQMRDPLGQASVESSGGTSVR